MVDHFIWRSHEQNMNSCWRNNWRNKGAETDLKTAQHHKFMFPTHLKKTFLFPWIHFSTLKDHHHFHISSPSSFAFTTTSSFTYFTNHSHTPLSLFFFISSFHSSFSSLFKHQFLHQNTSSFIHSIFFISPFPLHISFPFSSF